MIEGNDKWRITRKTNSYIPGLPLVKVVKILHKIIFVVLSSLLHRKCFCRKDYVTKLIGDAISEIFDSALERHSNV